MSDMHRRADRLRVSIIGASYYLSPAVFARQMGSLVRLLDPDAFLICTQFVAINSAPTSDAIIELPPGSVASAGRFFDISAYHTGALLSTKADVYILLNDTLFIKHSWRTIIGRIRAMIDCVSTAPVLAACGEVNPSSDLLMFDFDNPTRQHLSTFCFALNSSAFDMFKDLASKLPIDHTNAGIVAWLNEQMLHRVGLKNLLYVHLSEKRNPWSWQIFSKKQPSLELRNLKAVTVVFEYLFTQQLLLQGGLILPINIDIYYKIKAKLWRISSRTNIFRLTRMWFLKISA